MIYQNILPLRYKRMFLNLLLKKNRIPLTGFVHFLIAMQQI